MAEKLITPGKRNPQRVIDACGDADEKQRLTARRVSAVRQAGKLVRNRWALQKLFGELAERYQERPGGYTRIMKLGNRLGDNAELAIIELLPDGLAQSAAEPEAPADEVNEEAEAEY